MLNNSELVEKQSEEVNAFVSGLVGPDYQAAMIQRFPLAQLNFIPAEKLPYVGEGKAWSVTAVAAKKTRCWSLI